MEIKFRNLRENEIDVRAGHETSKGWVFLLYKDARVDMNLLDEVIGAENWQREHYECKGNLYCRVGIWSESKNQFIWKSDCGVESNTEKEKGEASDSFKRACVNWGIGRELYTAPLIFIPSEKLHISTGRTGKNTVLTKLCVSKIKTENGTIVELEISDEKTNKPLFYFSARKQAVKPLKEQEPTKQSNEPLASRTEPNSDLTQALETELTIKGTTKKLKELSLDWLRRYHNAEGFSEEMRRLLTIVYEAKELKDHD